jgi:hypothetical protein
VVLQLVPSARLFSLNKVMIGNLSRGRALTPNTAISSAASAVAPPGLIIDARFFNGANSVFKSASKASPTLVLKGL